MIKNSTDAFDVFKMIEIRAGSEQVKQAMDHCTKAAWCKWM
jgi:hypothetical protein